MHAKRDGCIDADIAGNNYEALDKASAPRADYATDVREPCTSSRWITTLKYTMLLHPMPRVSEDEKA